MTLFLDSAQEDWLRLYEHEGTGLLQVLMRGVDQRLEIVVPDEIDSEQDIMELLGSLTKADADMTPAEKDEVSKIFSGRAIPVLLSLRCMQVLFTCLIRHQASIPKLIERSKKGDFDSFFKLLMLDSVFLYAPWAKAMIIQAELTQDLKFKSELAKALEPRPGFWDLTKERDKVALLLMIMLGFAETSLEIWADFLTQHNLPDLDNAKTISRRCKELGFWERKPYPKRRNDIAR